MELCRDNALLRSGEGAAQALQEYIDQSPKEALQPWIRLLEVYRMANMREDFERIATSFEPAFQRRGHPLAGDQSRLAVEGIDFADAGEGRTLPKITARRAWRSFPHPGSAGIVVDKTGLWRVSPKAPARQSWGKRSGFSLAVVQEILFLAELRETLAQMDREAGES